MSTNPADSRRPSVLFLSFSPHVHGGADRSLLVILGGLDRSSFRPLLITPAFGELIDEAVKLGVEARPLDLVHYRRGPWVFLRGLHHLRRLCLHHHVDLIHCNAWTALQWAVPVAMSLRIPVVCHFREPNLGRQAGAIHLLRRSHVVIAVSAATKEYLVRAGVSKDKIKVVHNAIDLSPYDALPGDVSAEDNDKSSATVGMASRLVRWKGHRAFLQAAAEVVKVCPRIRFLIAGDTWPDGDVYRTELEELTRQLSLGPFVRFLGYQKDMVGFMKSLDVLVLPSHNEPFGRALIEAMAAAKPVVAFHGGGVSEIVDHGVNGLLVPPGDVAGLAGAIQELIADRTLARSMGKAGRAKVEASFSVARHLAAVEEVYRLVLKGSRQQS
jgi:glycosyltransferase involved in cell wall biosynthesis